LSPQILPRSIYLRAKDGVDISGLVYEAKQPKAVVLLYHQAGSSKAEHATIAPRLANSGFIALAIDKRSGGSLYGPNETAARLTTEATYEAAKPDLVAALE
jgi:alpha-beta hydrolase superfamily lysophospholipase